MTRKEAIKVFKTEVFPKWKEETKTTVRCTFNFWVDSLHRDGQIKDKQRDWCWNDGK